MAAILSAIVEAWDTPRGDVYIVDDDTTVPLDVARRHLMAGAVTRGATPVGMNVYVYDEAEECVGRWHWRF